MSRGREGQGEGSGVVGLREGGACRLVAWAPLSLQTSDGVTWHCPTCLEVSAPTAPFNCRSQHALRGNSGGPTFLPPPLKGTTPSQEGPREVCHFGVRQSPWSVLALPPLPSRSYHGLSTGRRRPSPSPHSADGDRDRRLPVMGQGQGWDPWPSVPTPSRRACRTLCSRQGEATLSQ